MYSYLSGGISELNPDQLVVDVGGIGFDVNIDSFTAEQLKDKEQAKVYVQLIVREDHHALFGFVDVLGKQLFNKLISVSGIGPNTARVILSSMSRQEVILAITTDREDAFKRVKGVGPKTAKRIILDLKDKLGDLMTNAADPLAVHAGDMNDASVHAESVAALVQLGFKKGAVAKLVDRLIAEDDTADTGAIVRQALAQLTGGRKS